MDHRICITDTFDINCNSYQKLIFKQYYMSSHCISIKKDNCCLGFYPFWQIPFEHSMTYHLDVFMGTRYATFYAYNFGILTLTHTNKNSAINSIILYIM